MEFFPDDKEAPVEGNEVKMEEFNELQKQLEVETKDMPDVVAKSSGVVDRASTL